LFFYKNNLMGTPRIHKTPNALIRGFQKGRDFCDFCKKSWTFWKPLWM